MTDPCGPRPYRVRTAGRHERTVPDHVPGPRFASRDDAETYAESLVRAHERQVIVEKLAPGGCWLLLTTLG
jgi:hypothetical protein